MFRFTLPGAAPVGREPVLDGVRGFALVMVMLLHCAYLLPTSALVAAWNHVAALGWFSVELFFVLSGYLITRNLIHTRGKPHYYSRFYLRRVLRIFPAYYTALLLVWLLLTLAPPPHTDGKVLQQWPYYLTYTHNWAMALNPSAFDWPGVDHFWSLAIEEQFYLIWPIILGVAVGSSMRRICIWLILGSIVTKFVLVAVHAPWTEVYMITTARFEGVAGGAFIATLTTPALIERWRPWIMRAGCVGLVGVAGFFVTASGLPSTLTLACALPASVAVFIWLLFAVQQQTIPAWMQRMFHSPVLVWLGLYSYGFYIYHYPISWTLRQWTLATEAGVAPDNYDVLLNGVLTVVISLIFARFMYALIEAPALRWRDWLEQRARKAKAHPPPVAVKPT